MNNLFDDISKDKNENKVAEMIFKLGKNPDLESLKEIFIG